jgi:hypothetical protein
MALVKCSECGNENAVSAATCPKCGARLKMGTGKKLLIGLGAFVLLGVIAAAGGKKPEGSTTVQAAAIQGAQAVAAAAARGTLEFGKPTVKTTMGMTKVDVEAKNISGQEIKGCMVTATFKKGDTILGTANGAVNEVPAGGTRTAQLIGTDAVAGYETMKLEASTCF